MSRSARRGTCAVILWAVMLATAAYGEPAVGRFTFRVASADPANPSGSERLELVVNRWSTDAERDGLFDVVTAEGPDAALNALHDAATGWVRWPGHLTYRLRYARQTTRADGGRDVVLVADGLVWVWWNGPHPMGIARMPYTVIRLRLNSEGVGHGTLAFCSAVRADPSVGLTLEEQGAPPIVLTDVQYEEASTSAPDGRRDHGRGTYGVIGGPEGHGPEKGRGTTDVCLT